MKLNVGCGRNIQQGWVNLDFAPLPGVDIVADLEKCATQPIPLEDSSVEEFLLSHVLEHITASLSLMQELWRIAKPNAKMIIRVPHGASDDAWEDPTHVRAYFGTSFGYFSQPYYWRADYGYRGDWQPEQISYVIDKVHAEGRNADDIMKLINSQRNIVKELIAEMRCVKPLREAKSELQQAHKIQIMLA